MLIWVVLAAFALALFLIFGALIEMFRTIEQIRVETGIMDSLTQIEIPLRDGLASFAGLPTELEHRERSLLLVLSEMCTTCRQLADRLVGDMPDGLWVVYEARSYDTGQHWLSQYGLANHPHVVVDSEGPIAQRLGIQISPAVIRLRDGVVAAAHTVPSLRRLEDELQWLQTGGPDQPSYSRPAEVLRFAK